MAADKGKKESPHDPTSAERDERFVIPLDPVEAIKAILKVQPEDQPVDETEDRRQ